MIVELPEWSPRRPAHRLVPALSALVIVIAGAAMTVRAIPKVS